MLPWPAVPTVTLPGLAFSQAMNPFRSLAGTVFFATITNGAMQSKASGSKSFSRSYGRLV